MGGPHCRAGRDGGHGRREGRRDRDERTRYRYGTNRTHDRSTTARPAGHCTHPRRSSHAEVRSWMMWAPPAAQIVQDPARRVFQRRGGWVVLHHGRSGQGRHAAPTRGGTGQSDATAGPLPLEGAEAFGQGVHRRQPHRLGGGADLLRRAVDLPRPAGPGVRARPVRSVGRSSRCWTTSARSRPGRSATSWRTRRTRCSSRRARPGSRRSSVWPWRSGRPPATSARSCGRANAIYDVPEGRPIWKTLPIRIGVTLATGVLLVVSVAHRRLHRRAWPNRSGAPSASVGPRDGVGHREVAGADRAGRPDVRDCCTGPRRTPGRAASAGSARAASSPVLLWVAASAGFAVYVANFGSYNKTYGDAGRRHRLPGLALDQQPRRAARGRARRRAGTAARRCRRPPGGRGALPAAARRPQGQEGPRPRPRSVGRQDLLDHEVGASSMRRSMLDHDVIDSSCDRRNGRV